MYASDLEEAEGVQARDMADVSAGEEKDVNADSLSPSDETEEGEKTVLSVMDEALAASEMNESENAFSDYFGYLMGNSYNLGFSMPGMEGVNQVRLDSGKRRCCWRHARPSVRHDADGMEKPAGCADGGVYKRL